MRGVFCTTPAGSARPNSCCLVHTVFIIIEGGCEDWGTLMCPPSAAHKCQQRDLHAWHSRARGVGRHKRPGAHSAGEKASCMQHGTQLAGTHRRFHPAQANTKRTSFSGSWRRIGFELFRRDRRAFLPHHTLCQTPGLPLGAPVLPASFLSQETHTRSRSHTLSLSLTQATTWVAGVAAPC